VTIGVVAIVKNEADVVGRMLRSTAPWAAAWVVSDTGSTDGTLAKVYKAQVDKAPPLATSRKPWQDFSANRNFALDEARRVYPQVDYWLSLDADETAEMAPGADPSCLEADLVTLEMKAGNTRFWAPRLIRAKGPCRWVGKCHEVPEAEGMTQERWAGITLTHHGDGHDSPDDRRLARNEMLLRAELHVHPDNPRTVFYLANTLEAAGRKKEAAAYFKQRAAMGTVQSEEGWYAHYRWGACQLATGDLTGVDTLLRATNRRPWRAEPLADLATYYYQQECEQLAKFFELAADSLPYPEIDCLFIEDALYDKELRSDPA